MYSIKEKLRILREINNPAAVEADLALLRTAIPDDPRLVKFDLSPRRHAEEITLALLDRYTREEIVANRRAHSKHPAESGKPAAESGNPEGKTAASSPEGTDDKTAASSPEGTDDKTAASSPEGTDGNQETGSQGQPADGKEKPADEKEQSEASAAEAKKKSGKSKSTQE